LNTFSCSFSFHIRRTSCVNT